MIRMMTKATRRRGMKGEASMDISFLIDLNGTDGESFEECLLLHIGENLILKLSKDGLSEFIEALNKIENELKNNYAIYK
jgi:hypothetical protein